MNSVGNEPELAYLYSLFACSPAMSTVATRDPAGYFDPTRAAHYEDPEIVETYTASFLESHKASVKG